MQDLPISLPQRQKPRPICIYSLLGTQEVIRKIVRHIQDINEPCELTFQVKFTSVANEISEPNSRIESIMTDATISSITFKFPHFNIVLLASAVMSLSYPKQCTCNAHQADHNIDLGMKENDTDGDKAISLPSNPFGPSYIDPSRLFSVRLLKEQHDTLEAHFQAEHNPSTTTKKGLAASLSVPVPIAKVNVSAKMKRV